MRPRSRLVASLLSLLAAGDARAAGYSVDVEMVRPSFAPGSVPGIDSPALDSPMSVRVGTLLQLEREPVVFYREGYLHGSAVGYRTMAQVGVFATLTRHVGAQLAFPVAYQVGSDLPLYAADGVRAGDLEGGVRVQVLRAGPLTGAVRAGLTLPLGAKESWIGEQWARLGAGTLLMAQLGPLSLLGDAGVVLRPAEDTDIDYASGPTLELDAAVRYALAPGRVYVSYGIVSRSVISHMWQGGAENASEALACLQLHPPGDLAFDAGAGVGIAGGMGAASWRAFGGLVWSPARRLPPVPPEPARLAIAPIESAELTAAEVAPDPEPTWSEGVLARVEETQIVIRDPIQFEFGTATILPVSIPTLDAIAELLRSHGEIAHLVIEGHASEEGSYAYNYELSDRRARSVFQALVTAGVHPDRVSYLGMGEVVPTSTGSSEEALAANRRVVFRIVRVFRADEPPPVYPAEVLLPWNGEPSAVSQPPAPVPPPPPSPPPEREPSPEDFEEDEPE